MLSRPPLSGVEHGIDIDIEFDFCEGGPSHGAHPIIIVFINPAL